MNCHLCAGVKHKVLLRRLLATFFDRYVLLGGLLWLSGNSEQSLPCKCALQNIHLNLYSNIIPLCVCFFFSTFPYL